MSFLSICTSACLLAADCVILEGDIYEDISELLHGAEVAANAAAPAGAQHSLGGSGSPSTVSSEDMGSNRSNMLQEHGADGDASMGVGAAHEADQELEVELEGELEFALDELGSDAGSSVLAAALEIPDYVIVDDPQFQGQLEDDQAQVDGADAVVMDHEDAHAPPVQQLQQQGQGDGLDAVGNNDVEGGGDAAGGDDGDDADQGVDGVLFEDEDGVLQAVLADRGRLLDILDFAGDGPLLPHPNTAMPRAQRVRAWQQRMDEQVAPHYKRTLRQYLHDIIKLRVEGQCTARSLTALLKAQRAAFDDGNLVPPDFNMVRRTHIVSCSGSLRAWCWRCGSLHRSRRVQVLSILGVKELWEYDWHVCTGCGMHAWPPLNPRQWSSTCAEHEENLEAAAAAAGRGGGDPGLGAVAEDSPCTCPRCHSPRFMRVTTAGTGSVKIAPHAVRCLLVGYCGSCIVLCSSPPTALVHKLLITHVCPNCTRPQRVYYLGVNESLVTPCLSNPKFCAQLGKHRTRDDPFTFWGSTECERLAEMVPSFMQPSGHPVLPHRVLAVSVAGDFGVIYESPSVSLGVIAMR